MTSTSTSPTYKKLRNSDGVTADDYEGAEDQDIVGDTKGRMEHVVRTQGRSLPAAYARDSVALSVSSFFSGCSLQT